MRFVTFYEDEHLRVGVSTEAGVIDLEGVASDRGWGDLVPEGENWQGIHSIIKLSPPFAEVTDLLGSTVDPSHYVGSLEELKLGPPIPDPPKILCVGLNYAAHADEAQLATTPVPTLFAKFANSLTGHESEILLPHLSKEVDYEAELAVVIGKTCKNVKQEDALDYIFGAMNLNDVSARDLQMQTTQFTAGKTFDTFAPCGPELVTLDELPDLQTLPIETRINGEVMQSAMTSQMIFSVKEIIEFCSSVMTLEPGDVIATGTPSGVGFSRTPPVYLNDGDVVEVEVGQLGCLRNNVVHEDRLTLA